MAKRGRPRKKKIEEKQPEILQKQPISAEIPVEEPKEKDNSGLEDRPYFSIDEAARYLGVNEQTARLWFEHSKLKGTNDHGFIRVSRASILQVRGSRLCPKFVSEPMGGI